MSRATGTNREDDGPPLVVPITTRRSIAPVPAPPPTTFIGRHDALALARGLIHRPDVRLLTLTGPGGIGKTRLALEIAAGCVAAFPDGIAWVPLASIGDPGLVLPAVASSLTIGEANSHDLHRQLVAALRNQRMLLVLDNFEHVHAAAAPLADVLRACPEVSALVTSRSPLRVSGEHLLSLPPLALPEPLHHGSPDQLARFEAVQMFCDRATAASPSFEMTATTGPLIAGICRRLDGLPLAIELAAARITHLSVSTLHDRLASRLPLLTGGPRDLPVRLQTLRDTIAWSHGLLSDDERVLFRHLAVFSGGFTLDAAEAISDDGGTAMDQLTALVDKSLVRHVSDPDGDSRYDLLQTIHEYAAEQLAASGDEATIRQRHTAYYLRLAREAEPGVIRGTNRSRRSHVNRLAADHDNLRRVLTWLAETDQWTDCLALATALCDFWETRGHLSEGRSWLERGLDRARDGGAPDSLCAAASAALGLFELRQGELDLAEAHLETARAVWLRLGDTAHLAFLVMMLGGVAEYRGDDARAQPLYEQALALFRDVDDRPRIAMALINLADTAYRRGDLAQAEALARQALDASREVDLPYLIGESLVTVGATASVHGDLDRAVTAFREAMRICRDAGFQLALGGAIAGLADVAAATGDPLLAARLLGAVDILVESLNVPRLGHDALHRHAVAATRARLDEATYMTAWAAGRAMPSDEVLAAAEAVSAAPSARVPDPFTPREREVLTLLVAGLTDRAIGEALFIGTRTVESHVARILDKLGVRTRGNAVATAIASGLIDPPPDTAIRHARAD